MAEMWNKIKSLFIEEIPVPEERGFPALKQGETLLPGNINARLLSDMTMTSSEAGVLSIAAAYRCISVRAESVAILSGDVIQSRNGIREKKNQAPQYDLLFRRPNPYQNSFQFRRQLIYNKLLNGIAYAVVRKRDKVGYPQWIEICRHMEMKVIDGNLWYYDPVCDEVYSHEDVVTTSVIGPDGKPKSPVAIHASTFGKMKASGELENQLYTSKMFAGAAITYPENIRFKKEHLEQLSESVTQNYGGVDKAGRVLALDQGATVHQFENIMSLQDAEYIASTNMSMEDVCRIFGVPPFKIFHFNKMTYDNMEQMSVEFVQSVVLPDVVELEQEYNYKLFTPYQRNNGYCVKHEIKSLLRADSAAQAAYVKAIFSIGGMTVNEVRELDDRNPVAGGDEAMIQANNYFPLSLIKEYAKAQISDKKAKKEKVDPAQGKLFDDKGEPTTDQEDGTDVTPAQS